MCLLKEPLMASPFQLLAVNSNTNTLTLKGVLGADLLVE